jgi:hypothetical protein
MAKDTSLGFDPIGAHYDGVDLSTVKTYYPMTEASKVMLQTRGANVRYTLARDATPSATAGFTLYDGSDPIILPVGPNTVFKFIQESPTADFQMQFGV